jgi:dTDP-4-amino-4,6-dideoxygalactose transaminase
MLRLQAGDHVLMPAYNCGSEIDPFIKAKISIDFYRVDRECGIDLSDLSSRITSKTKAIYVIHYFGFPLPIAGLKGLCERSGLYLIEDCALSLFSSSNDLKLGTIGDLAVFSFPKTLPVPDGGALLINNPNLDAGDWPTKVAPLVRVMKRMLGLFKSAILRTWTHSSIPYPVLSSQAGGRIKGLSPQHDLSKKPDIPQSYYYESSLTRCRISLPTRHIIDRCNYRQIIERRRANYALLLGLVGSNDRVIPLFKELPPNVCPLNFPVLVGNRDELCVRLNQMSIGAFPWWGGYHKDCSWDGFDDARYLKGSVLALPIHQDLTEEDIRYVADNLLAIV